MLELEQLLNEALNEVKHLNREEVFLLKDLYKGYVWNRIPARHRSMLGTLFLEYIKQNDIGVEIIEKTSSKQQKYQRTSKIIINQIS